MLDAGDELAVAGVNLNDLALVEVHGDLDDSAGVDRGRLGGTLDGVALKARVGLDDGGLDEHRRGHAHELVVGDKLALTVRVVVFFGYPFKKLAEAVRAAVVAAIDAQVGVEVERVDVCIDGLVFPKE